jgi:hypothetical protein
MKSFLFFLILVTNICKAQNVGIGETNPTDSKLQIKTTDSAALLIHNTSTSSSAKTALFYKSDANFSGSIATVKTSPGFYRMGLYTYGSGTASGLQERVSILDGGNVGIGTVNPTSKLEVAGSVKIVDGTEGTNKILTSDASGNATWKTIGSQFGYKKCIQYAPIEGGVFSGNFVVPNGVTEIMLELWGAGSGGTILSNIEKSFGGSSGGYARTVQQVIPGQTFTYTIGAGSYSSYSTSIIADGGNTVFNFATTSITAYGGKGRGANAITPNAVRSGTGTVDNYYFLYGNTGSLPTVDYKQKNATTFVEIRKHGDGGAAPGIIDAPIAKGGYTYFENGVLQYNINENSTANYSPASGAYSINSGSSYSGGNGMIVIWFN